MIKAIILAAVSATTLAWSVEASAAQVLLNFSGGVSASLTIDQSPIPETVTVTPDSFRFSSVPGTLEGVSGSFAALFSNESINLLNGGTFFSAVNLSNPIFSGPVTAPTFTLGTYSGSFTLSDALTGAESDGSFMLEISAVNPAIPEPATWAMLIGGFAMLGGALRWNRARATISHATA